jgi:hypothetical protein
MSASGVRNHDGNVGVRIERMNQSGILKDHTGKPDLPCVNTGKPQSVDGATRKHATYGISFESYLLNTGNLSRDAKADGK